MIEQPIAIALGAEIEQSLAQEIELLELDVVGSDRTGAGIRVSGPAGLTMRSFRISDFDVGLSIDVPIELIDVRSGRIEDNNVAVESARAIPILFDTKLTNNLQDFVGAEE